MKNAFPKFLVGVALSLGSISVTQAAIVTEYAMNFLAVTKDGTMAVNGATGGTWNYYAGYNPWVANPADPGLGDRSNEAAYASMGLAFYLPTLVLGETFSTFTINVNQYSIWDTNTEVDLYGLGTSATQSPSSIPYYAGTNDTASGVTKLQSSYLSNATDDGSIATWVASANIASYVNSLYSGGVPTQRYLMLRLSAQDEAEGLISIGSYSMLYGGVGNATTGVFTGAPNNWPANYASYNVIPEPSTWALMGGAAGLLVLRRRRA